MNETRDNEYAERKKTDRWGLSPQQDRAGGQP